MMWILPLIGYLGLVLGFAFLVLAIASGLYYLSELVEEYTVVAKKLITRLIYVTMIIQTLLWLVDGYPALLSIFSVASHALYLQNLRRFPIVKLSDPIFISSCILVLANHFVWFRHFSAPSAYAPARSSGRSFRRYPGESPFEPYPTFTEIASFFGLCVWLVPFSLFVSLSASENVLPSMGSEYATGQDSSYARSGAGDSTSSLSGTGSKTRQGMAKAAVDGVRTWLGNVSELTGWQQANSKSSAHAF